MIDCKFLAVSTSSRSPPNNQFILMCHDAIGKWYAARITSPHCLSMPPVDNEGRTRVAQYERKLKFRIIVTLPTSISALLPTDMTRPSQLASAHFHGRMNSLGSCICKSWISPLDEIFDLLPKYQVRSPTAQCKAVVAVGILSDAKHIHMQSYLPCPSSDCPMHGKKKKLKAHHRHTRHLVIPTSPPRSLEKSSEERASFGPAQLGSQSALIKIHDFRSRNKAPQNIETGTCLT